MAKIKVRVFENMAVAGSLEFHKHSLFVNDFDPTTERSHHLSYNNFSTAKAFNLDQYEISFSKVFNSLPNDKILDRSKLKVLIL